MKGRKEKFIFAALATLFSLSIFVVSVFASLNISARLSGSFNFSVPPGSFFLSIKGSATGVKDIPGEFNHTFGLDESNNLRSWPLEGLKFKENDQGQIDDIVFVFDVVNLNTNHTETINGGKVKVLYELVSIDEGITLTPSQNLENTIQLAPLSSSYEESQTDNKATFNVILSPKDKSSGSSLTSARFQFRLKFEFVE